MYKNPSILTFLLTLVYLSAGSLQAQNRNWQLNATLSYSGFAARLGFQLNPLTSVGAQGGVTLFFNEDLQSGVGFFVSYYL